ncbi:MAG: transcription termination/antitermination NusG family protein, partial [Thermoflexales bacterium]
MELSWYALQSKPHKESQLLRGLESAGFEAWYPSYRVKPVNPRSRKIRPLFPRYLFVRINLEEQPVSTFTWMANAIGLVSFGDEPAPVPDRLIEAVHERLREMTNVLGYAEEFNPGDR